MIASFQTIARIVIGAFPLLAACGLGAATDTPHLIVLDPQHSHAAGVFSRPIEGVSKSVHVYAPAGPGVDSFLASLAAFNRRKSNPTDWQVETHIAPDFQSALLKEQPGNIVVMTGRNDLKIKSILASLRAGQNVLADKPWIIRKEDFNSLVAALDLANHKKLAFYDGMTERFNAVYQIQRELMRDPQLFGRSIQGTEQEPAVELENLHSLVKFSGGKVNLRPTWFLDINKQGEALADVGTHLVDLNLWMLFPDQSIDYRRDVKILSATRSPIYLTLPEFERLTGAQQWPDFLLASVHDNRLSYFCNNTASYSVRGIHSRIMDRWEYESKDALSDSYRVIYHGSRSSIRVRQTKTENYVAELDLTPSSGVTLDDLQVALDKKLHELSARYPGLTSKQESSSIQVVIPKAVRNAGGFESLVEQFLKYVKDPQSIPKWEGAELLAKYYITTSAVAMADK
jgi:predicted dehydrogenase